MVFELLNPRFNEDMKKIEYDVTSLDNPSSKNITLSEIGSSKNATLNNLRDEFGISTLFIDSKCPNDPWDSRACS